MKTMRPTLIFVVGRVVDLVRIVNRVEEISSELGRGLSRTTWQLKSLDWPPNLPRGKHASLSTELLRSSRSALGPLTPKFGCFEPQLLRNSRNPLHPENILFSLCTLFIVKRWYGTYEESRLDRKRLPRHPRLKQLARC